MTALSITCANGLAWNDEISNCDHPENVELCNEAGDNDGDAEDDTNESEVTGNYFISILCLFRNLYSCISNNTRSEQFCSPNVSRLDQRVLLPRDDLVST
jgi:hypothetical protein